jgi:hypothetical protein
MSTWVETFEYALVSAKMLLCQPTLIPSSVGGTDSSLENGLYCIGRKLCIKLMSISRRSHLLIESLFLTRSTMTITWVQKGCSPPETFGNLLLLYCKQSNGLYNLAADVMAKNADLTFRHLTKVLMLKLFYNLLTPSSAVE